MNAELMNKEFLSEILEAGYRGAIGGVAIAIVYFGWKYLKPKIKKGRDVYRKVYGIEEEKENPVKIKELEEKQAVSQEALSPKIVLGIFLIMAIITTVVILIAVNN